MERIHLHTEQREELREITAEVREALRRSELSDGPVALYVPHTTAAVTINENADPDVAHDLTSHLGRIVPRDPRFHHAEGNADAHIKASLIGPAATLIVAEGRLMLGQWQGIFFCEFDGPRAREVWIQMTRAV